MNVIAPESTFVFVVVSIVALILAFVSPQASSATGDEAGLYKTRRAIWHEPDRTGKTPSVQKTLEICISRRLGNGRILTCPHVVAQGIGEMPAS